MPICLIRPSKQDTDAVWVCKKEKRDRMWSEVRLPSWNLLLDLQRLDPVTLPYHTKHIFW